MSNKSRNKSPFGLFMEKMKMNDKSLKSKSMADIVVHCKPFYDGLSPQIMDQLKALSDWFKSSDNRDKYNECMNRLKTIDINIGNNVSNCVDLHDLNYNRKDCAKDVDSDDEECEHSVNDFDKVKTAVNNHLDLKKMSIIVISFNVSVHTIEDNYYYPNEVGITRFNLIEGIQQEYHKRIPIAIPNGYYSVAKEHSESTHKIPLNTDLNDVNYEEIYTEIYDMISLSDLIDSEGKKLIFCKTIDRNGKTDKPQVIGSLKWLEMMANNGRKASDFYVMDLTELLNITIRKVSDIMRPMNLLIDDLSKITYDYSRQMSCHYHENIDNQFCALGMSKRIVYLFFDVFFELKRSDIEIERTKSHKPVEEDSGPMEESVIKFNSFATKYRPMSRNSETHYFNDRPNDVNHNLNPRNPGVRPVGVRLNSDIRKPYGRGIGRGKFAFMNNNRF